jgi:hypothetical protein
VPEAVGKHAPDTIGMETEMRTKEASPVAARASEASELHIRYGKIGISAVAAAMHYHRTTPTEPAATQREPGKSEHRAEAAA